MTIPLSVCRSDFRRTEPNEVVLKKRLDGPDRSSGQQQVSVPTVQSRDERALFDEVFLPHMAEAYRLAH
jgi:RNA polymerase sigma-70 factor (ECF subfamily)